MPVRETSQLMSATEIDRTLLRLAHEIAERNNGAEGLALVGIRTLGATLAERLTARIGEIEQTTPPVASLDVTFYRDDLSKSNGQPVVEPHTSPFRIAGQMVVLVDDVLYTGSTTRAALDALMDNGRPRRVELCVLIGRGHRELPIEANYVGRIVHTSSSETIDVRLREVNGEDRVLLWEADG
jgi:pyrimidine operon attenuation protein/uracil phosphoribosyltransferase